MTRSFYIENVLYTVSLKKVKMNDVEDLEEVNEVELPYEGAEEQIYRIM